MPEENLPASAAAADAKIGQSLRETLKGTILGSILDPEDDAPPEVPAPAASTPEKADSPTPTPAPTPAAETPKAPPPPDKPKTTKIGSIKDLPPDKFEDPRKPQPVQKTAEPPPEVKPEAKPEAPKEEKPKKKLRPPPPQPPVDYNEIAKTTAQAVVQTQAMLEQQKKQEKLEADLPDNIKRQIPILEQLHQNYPDKYPADLAKRLARHQKEELEYALAWEKEHPGESFQHSDEEHEEWYEKHRPKIDREDLDEARTQVTVRKTLEREVEPKRRELEQRLERQTITPFIEQSARSLAGDIVKSVAPSLDGVTEEHLNKLSQEDPIAYEVVHAVNNTLAQVVYEGGMVWHALDSYNPENQAHVAAKNLLNRFEKQLSALEPEEKQRNGKPWVPLAEYVHLDDDQRKRVITTEYNDLVQYIRKVVGPEYAKKTYEQKMAQSKSLVDRLAPKLGYRKADSSNPSGNGEAEHAPSPPLPASPSMPAGPPAQPISGPSTQNSQSPADIFFQNIGLR